MSDKVSVVTGGLGLLGKEHCQALADAGSHVIVADLDESGCKEFASTLSVPSRGIFLDVTDPDSIFSLAKQVMDEFRRIDVLVNNAGINDMVEDPALSLEESRFETYPLRMWKKIMEVNVTGVFLCSQIIGRQMIAQGHGSIINIASTYGIVAPDQSLYRDPEGVQRFYKSPAYPASKGSVIAFTKYLAAYCGHAGVRVNALSPGGVANGQDTFFRSNYARRTPLCRMASRQDFRGALVFLASDASRYMTGVNLVVDGGWTVL